MQIQFTNTLTRQKENFEPIENEKVGIYSCGPTVYASPHIGNFRAFIFADLLRRSLEFFKFEVNHVMNITDVGHLTSDSDHGEDKLEKGAAREGVSPLEVARKYEAEFLRDLEKLNILKPQHLPRASEHIPEQVELIRKLKEKGFAYETSDGVYFDTAKFENYGKLGGQKLEEKEAGKRVEAKSEKRNPTDFALWKFCVGENENHILRWDLETGANLSQDPKSKIQSPKSSSGFPGWHLECSAMSSKYLGESFDIHTGGIDHIPIHHENEIAQSEAASGKKFVNYWLHNEFLTVDGGKMSKSLGNLFTLTDLEKKSFDALDFRYLCLNSHYRSKLNFTWEALQNARNSLSKLRAIFQNVSNEGEVDSTSLNKFEEALGDDLNLPEALAVTWEFAKSEQANQSTLKKFDEVLGLNLEKAEEYFEVPFDEKIEGRSGIIYLHGDISAEEKAELTKLAKSRFESRAKKDWGKSDELRKKIEDMGWGVEDSEDSEDSDCVVQKLKFEP